MRHKSSILLSSDHEIFPQLAAFEQTLWRVYSAKPFHENQLLKKSLCPPTIRFQCIWEYCYSSVCVSDGSFEWIWVSLLLFVQCPELLSSAGDGGFESDQCWIHPVLLHVRLYDRTQQSRSGRSAGVQCERRDQLESADRDLLRSVQQAWVSLSARTVIFLIWTILTIPRSTLCSMHIIQLCMRTTHLSADVTGPCWKKQHMLGIWNSISLN